MELRTDGGMTEFINRIVNANNNAEILAVFDDIVIKSYGVRNEDNKGFDKSPEIARRFMSTDAYSVLFMELVTDAEASANFIKGIVPPELSAKMNETEIPTLSEPVAELPSAATMLSSPDKDLTSAELQSLSHQELVMLMKAKNAERK